ncbi:nickel-dependent lactate racemase [Lactonifactor longoviformis]|uniref:nickel-dependent lactate racemase n=1 Tax=Lactonifactor longoviformis TaxID=341220 RepID=UPI0036F3E177
MKIELKYGEGIQIAEIPDKHLKGVLLPEKEQGRRTEEEEIADALEYPIGTERLRDLVQPGHRAVIITSDITRPFPSATVLPFVLRELEAGGIPRENVTVVFALGSHRTHTKEEMARLLGKKLWGQVSCRDSDPLDCVRLGTTARGTPVDVTRAVAEADIKICLGNIEYHYFAGYSGGAKAVMPGVSSWEAIQNNHKLMASDQAAAGRLEDNPVREDIEEAGRICGIDFILNAVLDRNKKIAKAFAGDAVKAHRAGCRYADRVYRRRVDGKADIVVVSPGGFPKDVNLYQTQKALDNAAHAVKRGGIIILAGECREGVGSPVLQKWLTEAETPRKVLERIAAEFELGGHKAAAIAGVQEKASVYLISELPASVSQAMFFIPARTVQEALEEALDIMGKDASVLVIPSGGAVFPYTTENG